MNIIDSELAITIVFDNHSFKEGLDTAWGFSALITGAQKSILFDTGPDGEMLLRNMEKLGIDPMSIDTVVLSHKHPDHTGGLVDFLIKNRKAKVYVLNASGENLKNRVRACGAEVIALTEPVEICGGIYSTGQMGRLIKEQVLIINTNKGAVVIAGCSHPGILTIIQHAREIIEKEILLVLGGFHLEWITAGKVQKIITDFKQMQVKNIAPAHCTGKKAKSLLKDYYKENYIDIGVGSKINLTELK
ncbi:MAG: MBL fold metallo-hydrolase [Planctomycetota bacterium]